MSQIILNSGKTLNDLGDYDACQRNPLLTYGTITVTQKGNSCLSLLYRRHPNLTCSDI